MKLLHPFMPFVTSEIYDNLVHYTDTELIVSKWPQVKEKPSFDIEEELIEKIKTIIVEIRNIRATKNIHPSKKSELIFVIEKDYEIMQKQLQQLDSILLKLGFANKVTMQKDNSNIQKDAIKIITDGIEVYIPLEGLIDLEEERKRLEDEKKKLEGEVARCEKMLSNPGFINKAPEAKINEEEEKLEKYKTMLAKVIEALN